MKNFSLFAGLGVFVCLSVGGRVDEWVLGQIKVSFMFYSRNSIYMVLLCIIRFSGCYYHSGVSMSSLCPSSLDLFIYLSIGESKFKNPS